MRHNIQSIAKELGVAPSTVSRALSGKPGVSRKRRDEICAAARELGYVPDPHASSLRSRKGSGLTLVAQFQPAAIASARNEALFSLAQTAFGQVRVLVPTRGMGIEAIIQQCFAQSPRAIVFSGKFCKEEDQVHQRCRERGIACCALDAKVPDMDSVIVNRVPGMRQAARLLVLSGCKHPRFFSPGTLENPENRIKGIMEAYESLGIELKEEAIIQIKASGNSFEFGYHRVLDLLRSSAADGLFCYNDQIAMGAMKACADLNLRVPNDVKIIGFDNLPFTEYAPCPITTVAQPVEPVAEAAIRLCLERAEDPSLPIRHKSFPTRLIARQSAPITSNEIRHRVFADAME